MHSLSPLPIAGVGLEKKMKTDLHSPEREDAACCYVPSSQEHFQLVHRTFKNEAPAAHLPEERQYFVIRPQLLDGVSSFQNPELVVDGCQVRGASLTTSHFHLRFLLFVLVRRVGSCSPPPNVRDGAPRRVCART